MVAPAPDSNSRETHEERVRRLAGDHLLRHGHAFQFAVLHRADELLRGRLSHWRLSAAEFPVAVQGDSVHIDAVLERPNVGIHRTEIRHLIVECKRVNPGLADWCFVRAPYVRQNHRDFLAIVECARPRAERVVTEAVEWAVLRDVYAMGFEIAGVGKGDDRGSGRGAIDQAITQVFRGLNGLVEALCRHPKLLGDPEGWLLIPVIFTTATLWQIEADLENADLATGALREPPNVQRVPWLALNYPVSPSLRHEAIRTQDKKEIGEHLAEEHLRTVFIVSPAGIDGFFGWSSQY